MLFLSIFVWEAWNHRLLCAVSAFAWRWDEIRLSKPVRWTKALPVRSSVFKALKSPLLIKKEICKSVCISTDVVLCGSHSSSSKQCNIKLIVSKMHLWASPRVCSQATRNGKAASPLQNNSGAWYRDSKRMVCFGTHTSSQVTFITFSRFLYCLQWHLIYS